MAATARTCAYFYPRPLRGGRPGSQPDALTVQTISIHALCEEGDDVLGQSTAHIKTFLSTPSARRATQVCGQITNLITFLSTPSARRATQKYRSCGRIIYISIHALCEEGDAEKYRDTQAIIEFLSTPSARRATRRAPRRQQPGAISIHALCEEGDNWRTKFMFPQRNFYPRPLRGGRPKLQNVEYQQQKISIHALCEEGDLRASGMSPMWKEFLSTPSARRATPGELADAGHAGHFYPRPLRGGRREDRLDMTITCQFLSTPSARRATRWQRIHDRRQRISIHALCEEGDRLPLRHKGEQIYFYPRPLRGGRPPKLCYSFAECQISIHALCEEGDGRRCSLAPKRQDFYPRPLRGGRPHRRRPEPAVQGHFYPRPLRGGRLVDDRVDPLTGEISIHALCEEGDGDTLNNEEAQGISIHALCEEGDDRRPQRRHRDPISIHALCEEGDVSYKYAKIYDVWEFLSTPSARRATW